MNLGKLKSHILDITTHTAICDQARYRAANGENVITFESEKRNGFYCLLTLKCCGCNQKFDIENSDKISETSIQELNLRCVWGSMVTGGGCSSLNESMGTIGIPGIQEKQYCLLEHEIGKFWKNVLEEEMFSAAQQEKQIAIDNDDYFQGVPAISVVCDGGWSKRSHKHTYNAMAGVGVIFGLNTKKLLHIGIRNKLCYICSRAKTTNIEPAPHECFKNWDQSSQSMESNIILEGFQLCESKFGVRYMRMIADGDSSVYANIVKNVAVWGCHVQKIECANHATKCLRSNLEKLVCEKPEYKGRGKLTKNNIRRITAGVRCAIVMRSSEPNRTEALKKLKKDIRNAGRHVLGHHDLCSTDFCKWKTTDSLDNENQTKLDSNIEDDDDILICQTNYWKDSVQDLSSADTESLQKGGLTTNVLDSVSEQMLKDLFLFLNRLSEKSDRLIGNFTSNLAESWMNVRCKFDGGKMYNKCYKGSFYARCYGGALRTMLGPAWSPLVYQQITHQRPDMIFLNTYKERTRKFVNAKNASRKKENILKRKKRKLVSGVQKKKDNADYGENVLIDTDDIATTELQKECDSYYKEEVFKSNRDEIEKKTRGQSENDLWKAERRKRITSSIFGDIMSRSPNNNNPNLVKRLLYSSFRGNMYTIRGQNEEQNARIEYMNIRNKENKTVLDIEVPGLIIENKRPYLASSSDGIVVSDTGPIGLIEIKTLLNKNKTMISEAAETEKQFCLRKEKGKLTLKPGHKYFYQIQGQLNILGFDWCDLIIRRVNPHDIYIHRIQRDQDLWENIMAPKLKAFYFSHILPELAVPRHGTVSGIRKPSLPWYEDTSTRTRKTATGTKSPQAIPAPQGIPSTSATDTTPISVQAPVHSKRTRKLKFVGRRINHQWKLDDGTLKWYLGTVLSTSKGRDGYPNTVYQVLYDGEQEAYDIEDLQSDYDDGSLKFSDI